MLCLVFAQILLPRASRALIAYMHMHALQRSHLLQGKEMDIEWEMEMQSSTRKEQSLNPAKICV